MASGYQVSLAWDMQSITVKLLWFALAGSLALLVLVLAVTGDMRYDQEAEIEKHESKIEKLEQEKQQLNKELEVKRETKLAEAKRKDKPTPVYIPVGKDKIVAEVYATFGTDPRILTLIQCESGFNERATGYDGSPYFQYNFGLFQVADTHGYSAEYLYNPYNNIKVAKQILDRQGFGAWPNCARIAGLLI